MSRSVIPHLLLAFGGYLGSAAGAEIWQCSLRLTPLSTGENFTTDAATAGTRVAAVAGSANMQTLLNAPVMTGTKVMIQSICDANVALTWVKLNAIKADGLQLNPVTLLNSFAAVVGTQGSGSAPWSSGAIFEHRTNNRSRGFSSHGRMTLPAPISVDRATGRITTVGSNTVAVVHTAYGAWLAKLNLQDGAASSYAFYPSIGYGTDSSKTYVVPGVSRAPVTSKIDTFYMSTIAAQNRSRQNKLVRLPAPVTVAYGAVNT